tara:strand:- start:363 stop:911 length:549 start_codon:yes stop_codon:yes gene_type:complete
MTDIYIEISKLTDKFREMAYGLTIEEDRVNEAVQELMLYFLQMNPTTLRSVYDKDGIDGIIRYGAVALRRSLTSKRSNFYYKFDKYYSHVQDYSNKEKIGGQRSIYNIPQPVDEFKWNKLEEIDLVLDRLDSWYDRELFKLYYYEGNTLDSLAAKTKISRNSLYITIDKVRTILKKELNEDV